MAPSGEEIRNALAVLKNVDKTSFADDEAGRAKALGQARDLVRRLEAPRERLTEAMWMQPATSTAIKVALDLKLLELLPPSEPGLTVGELADKTGAAAEFLERILRLLASTRFVQRTSTNTFYGTPTSQAFTQPGLTGGMTHLFAHVWPCFAGVPSYLQTHGYRSPEDPSRGPWQHGLHTDAAFFDWLSQRPAEAEGFHNLMASAHTASVGDWSSVYPVAGLVQAAAEAGVDARAPLVVDVGGGVGQDMQNLAAALRPARVTLEVQDVASVVEQGRRLVAAAGIEVAADAPVIEFRAHDFFRPQPVVGAKAYFLHSILHDWPDQLAIKILQNLHGAMKLGYSKLLLNERIVPKEGYSSITASMDLIMMGLLCSKERTEEDWEKVLSAAGFRIEKIWHMPIGSRTSVIEAVPIPNSKANI